MTVVAAGAVVAGDPAPVAAAIVALLRGLPGPAADPSASPEAVAGWLTAKADLLDRIASASADPDLAARAASYAVRARAAVARLEPLTGAAAGCLEGAPNDHPDRPGARHAC